MLKKLSPEINIDAESFMVPVSKASFPSPFKDGLEFNAPAHGVWNIVHTGMLIPEAHQIFVCSAGCMRGVVLTAAEMNASGRFSQVLIEEKDLICKSLETLTVEGVCDCILKLPKRPRAVLVFTVCLHHFTGADLDWIYKELNARFPDITFIRCFMDPIMKKSGLTPDQKIRKSIYEAIDPLPVNKKSAALLGSDFALDESCDIKMLLAENGFKIKELPDCTTYEEYLSMGECSLFISCYPPAKDGAAAFAKRLKRPHIHIPLSFGACEIINGEKALALMLYKILSGKDDPSFPLSSDETPQEILRLIPESFFNKKEEADKAMKDLKKLIGDAPVAIDYTFHPRPLGLAKLLLGYGFNVAGIYTDVISKEEEADYYYLKENYPDLLLCAASRPECRVMHGSETEGFIALGQKAAWFTESRHFANIVEGAGLQGFDGIIKLSRAVKEAAETEKDPKEYITAKGLGCECCIL